MLRRLWDVDEEGYRASSRASRIIHDATFDHWSLAFEVIRRYSSPEVSNVVVAYLYLLVSTTVAERLYHANHISARLRRQLLRDEKRFVFSWFLTLAAEHSAHGLLDVIFRRRMVRSISVECRQIQQIVSKHIRLWDAEVLTLPFGSQANVRDRLATTIDQLLAELGMFIFRTRDNPGSQFLTWLKEGSCLLVIQVMDLVLPELQRKLAERGDSRAQTSLGWMYAEGRGVQQDEAEAIKWYRKASDRGDALAQARLGRMYAEGRGVQQDYAEAEKWYRKAADRGHAGGQTSLGWMYAEGRGVKRDDAEAVKCYRKAAKQGDAAAQNNLGWMYAKGRGVQQDDAEAVKWYRKAAVQGHAVAQSNLGPLYAEGRGVQQDDAEAVKWLRNAAEQGIAGAQFSVGVMYEKGRGVQRDNAEAAMWYRKAADQGYDGAQLNLGVMYVEGWGVQQDEAEAVKWFRKAAEQGNVKAQRNLAKMYAEGRGGASE
jgi:uncharacterized protein